MVNLMQKVVVPMLQRVTTFFALCSRGEKEESLDVVTSMLHVFFIDVYDLLHPGDIL